MEPRLPRWVAVREPVCTGHSGRGGQRLRCIVSETLPPRLPVFTTGDGHGHAA